MTGVCRFWQPRRARTHIDMADRCRPRGMRTSAVMRPPGLSVNFEVETFKIFGSLRKTQTEVHNSLPTLETIQTERTLLTFEEKRRQMPDDVDYGDFYRSLTSSITSSLSSRAPSAITFGRRAADTTKSHDDRKSLETRGSSQVPRSLSYRGDNWRSLDSRSGTRASNSTGPLGQGVRAPGPRVSDSPSARSLNHIHGLAMEQRRSSNSEQPDARILERRLNSRHQEVDSLILDFLSKESGE